MVFSMGGLESGMLCGIIGASPKVLMLTLCARARVYVGFSPCHVELIASTGTIYWHPIWFRCIPRISVFIHVIHTEASSSSSADLAGYDMSASLFAANWLAWEPGACSGQRCSSCEVCREWLSWLSCHDRFVQGFEMAGCPCDLKQFPRQGAPSSRVWSARGMTGRIESKPVFCY